MARPRSSNRDYEALRESSGWYLAAWRDYRGLSQEELGAELGTSKGRVSDFETGATRSSTGGLAARINRDALEAFARALNTTAGRLIDVNPFSETFSLTELPDRVALLEPRDREEVIRLIDVLQRRAG